MKWWVTAPDGGAPIGPVTKELMLRALLSGRVPKHSLICPEGESEWRWVGDVPEFLAALEERGRQRAEESVLLDADLLDVEDEEDVLTAVNRSPFRPSAPPTSGLHRFEDADEQTIVDAVPFGSSEPPSS